MKQAVLSFLRGGGSALPGYRLALAATLVWTGFFILLPLSALIIRPWQDGVGAMVAALHDARMFAALWTSFSCAFLAALLNIPLGLLLAWTLVRGDLPGRRVADAVIDLPLALPTAVSGITLATLYGPQGWLGAPLAKLGLVLAYSRTGIVLALMFVGLPFVVRTVEPVLKNLPRDMEEAAVLLGARPWQVVTRVIIAPLLPALLTGFGLALARGVGEYGSVIFIAGNQPFKSEIAPLLIVVRLQEFDYAGATAIALILLLMSLLALVLVSLVRWRLSVWGEQA
ncbi:sulfate ABC transporter permease subunit CysT [Acetobacter orleanensis]|uniref:Sulfate transport system permease protein CysT n=1 Tax=Acetobacter orleanensis TaxID=104099 RepID=A0A4Y3TJK3_9PROT|nr:sulfate ABC transporter permease subunit CysT [Acetobacter orleanensis]KXV61978.1 sulfate/thiosulfate transporter subunit [Acetobacter orleanensis]PCD80311.1 sulfate ABC transporter permease subunit CysT [Acetobacter orleanensis]GAN68943.1 ABC transporter sulfate permease CysW/CysT [Acetobacter orleanensis JCM 7639]GBR30654.1 sulfate transporter permease CysT [Acetobacter orleanensis NRIC 0473]GEB81649.1 sulfate ABC transporter permease [Acetobacter orleanensis]